MDKKKYPIEDYVEVVSRNDVECQYCGETIPAGSRKMLPRQRKRVNYSLCLSCFNKWKSKGDHALYPDKDGHHKKEHVILMSKIMGGNCDLIKGRKLYVALKKAISEDRSITLKFETDQPISLSTRVMNPSFGEIMDEYGTDIFKGNLKLVNVPKGAKDMIVNYIDRYKKL